MGLYMLQGIGYGFSAAAQPGPFQTYVISQTLSRGWRRTLPAACAPLLSDGPIILLTTLVLSRVPEWLQRLLYVAGGLFLLYLAWRMFVAWRNFDAAGLLSAPPNRRGLLEAALINLLSPGPYIFWSLVGAPTLLAGWRVSPASGAGFLAGFYAAMTLTLAGLILLFGAARRLGPAVNRALVGVSAAALAAFGLYQLWRGVMALRGG